MIRRGALARQKRTVGLQRSGGKRIRERTRLIEFAPAIAFTVLVPLAAFAVP